MPRMNDRNGAKMEKNRTIAKIEELMAAKGWKLYRLAKEADIPYSSLNNLFKRNTEPTLTNLRLICSALGITLSDFFSDEKLPMKRDFTDDEKHVIMEYRHLELAEQRLLKAYLHGLRRIPLKQGG